MSDVVLLERVAATQVVTIHRPESRNALTRAVLRELGAAMSAAAADPAVRCVVLAGAGGHFCAGADLRQTIVEDPAMMDHLEEYMDDFHGLIRGIVRCEKPVIARMEGAAVGFGADLALACDLRVAAAGAYVQEKFVRLGLMPDGGGSFWLPRLVGTARAMQMILFAEKVDAAELERLGVVMRVVPPEDVHEATLGVARRIEAGPPLAHAAIKRALYANLGGGGIEDALRREREEQLKLLRSSDLMEGVAAWMQKREPEFQGR